MKIMGLISIAFCFFSFSVFADEPSGHSTPSKKPNLGGIVVEDGKVREINPPSTPNDMTGERGFQTTPRNALGRIEGGSIDRSNSSRTTSGGFNPQAMRDAATLREAQAEEYRRRINNPTREEIPGLIREHEQALVIKSRELASIAGSPDVQRLPLSMRENIIKSRQREVQLDIDRIQQRISRYKELEIARE